MSVANKNRKRNTAPRGPVPLLAWLGLGDGASIWVLVLIAMVFASGLSVVYLSHRDRILFAELQELRERANELDVQWGQLLIEQSTLGVGGRVEQWAMESLGMYIPDIENFVLVPNE